MDPFTQLITSVRDRLYRLALRVTGDADEAEDVVQDVLVKGWRKRREIVNLDNPPARLLWMTRHQAIDRLRAARLRGEREREAAAPDLDTRTPYRIAAGNDALGRVERLLASLPTDQRTVLQLREVEGLEYREIVAATGLTLTQVKVYLHRGRSRLRQLLTSEMTER